MSTLKLGHTSQNNYEVDLTTIPSSTLVEKIEKYAAHFIANSSEKHASNDWQQMAKSQSFNSGMMAISAELNDRLEKAIETFPINSKLHEDEALLEYAGKISEMENDNTHAPLAIAKHFRNGYEVEKSSLINLKHIKNPKTTSINKSTAITFLEKSSQNAL